MTAHVRENVEKKEHSSTAGGTEAGTTSLEFSVEIAQNRSEERRVGKECRL